MGSIVVEEGLLYRVQVFVFTQPFHRYYQPIANLHRHAPNICIEGGRQNTPGHNRPGFTELEEALKATKDAA